MSFYGNIQNRLNQFWRFIKVGTTKLEATENDIITLKGDNGVTVTAEGKDITFSGSNNYQKISGDSGNISPDSYEDTLRIKGNNGITTSASNDTVTIDGSTLLKTAAISGGQESTAGHTTQTITLTTTKGNSAPFSSNAYIKIPNLTISEAGQEDGYLTYTFQYGGQDISTKINIPLNLILNSSEVIIKDEEFKGDDNITHGPGTYLHLKFNTSEGQYSHCYIDVTSLYEITGAATDTITVEVDENQQITANVNAGSITATELADDAVETSKIKNVNVTTEKIADKAVTAAKIADNTITATQIAANAITSSELADDAVDTAAIQDSAVKKVKLNSDVLITMNIPTATTPTDDTVDVVADILPTSTKLDLSKTRVKVATKAGVDAGDANTLEQAKSYVDENNIFETDILTVNALGGIEAGADLNSLTTHEILNKLLYPYVAQVVENPSRTPSSTVLEKGNNQTITAVSVKVTKKSEAITKVELYNDNTLLATKEGDEVATGGTFTFSGLSVSVPSTNVVLTVKVTDASGNVVSKNTPGWTFVYPYYYGVCAERATINETLIESLTKKVENKGSKTDWSFTCDNQRMVFAYPKSYGVLKSIIDPNNFEIINSFTQSEVSITGLDNTTQTYYVYVSGVGSVTNFKVDFKY